MTYVIWASVLLSLVGDLYRHSYFGIAAVLVLLVVIARSPGAWLARGSGRLALILTGIALGMIAVHGDVGRILRDAAGYFGIIALLLCVSLIRIPVRAMRLDAAVLGLLARVSERRRVPTVMVSSTMLAPVLNLGTVALLGAMLRDRSIPTVSVPRAVTRGVGAALLWAPTFAPTALIMTQFPNVTWSHTLPIAIPLALAALLLGGREKGVVAIDAKEATGPEPLWNGLLLVAVIGALMLVLRIGLHMSITSAVSLAAVGGFAIWTLLWDARRAPEIRSGLRDHTENAWRQVSAESVLFLSAGLLASVLQDPYWSASMEPVRAIVDTPGWMSIAIIIFGIPALTVVGIHPIVPYTLLVGQITPDGIGISPEGLYMLWTVVWMLSMLLSPASALNLSAASSFGVSPWRVGARANWSFGVMFGAVAVVVLREWS